MGYRTERIFVLAAILLIGLGLTLAVSRGTVSGASSDNAGLLWTLTIALVLVAAGGSVWLRSGLQPLPDGQQSGSLSQAATGTRAVPSATRQTSRLPLPLEAVVPALLVGGFTLFIQLFDSGIVQTLILIVATLAFGAVYWAQLHASDIGDRYFGLSQAVLNIISHLCAFLLFATIYGLKTRSLISATAVALVTLLLAYELLSRDADWHHKLNLPVEGRRATIVIVAIVCGLILGELTWGLNYWAALTTLVGGAFLLVAFYVTYGLASHYLDQKLTRQTVLEFGLVGLVGIAAVFFSAFLVG